MIQKRILQKETKLETPLRAASRDIRTNKEGINNLKTVLESLKTEKEEAVNGKMKRDMENKIRRINRPVKKIEDILEGKPPMTSDLDMGKKKNIESASSKRPRRKYRKLQ